MARFNTARNKLQVFGLMAVYVILMIFEWPLVATAHSLTVRVVLALLPAAPVVAALALIARRVLRGDELEQRLHMVALGVATGVVSAASIVGAFLVGAGVWRVGGDILFWVFPALALVYGVSRVVLTRKVSGGWSLWGC